MGNMLMTFSRASFTGVSGSLLIVALAGSSLTAQTPGSVSNSIQLLSPVDVRLSAAGTGYGSSIATFNSTTVNLSCPAVALTGVLSSTADGTGNLLVDNNIDVTVTAPTSSKGPTNVCTGGVDTSPVGPFPNCFTSSYETAASAGKLTDQDPDLFVATGGVPPIDISKLLVSGALELKLDFQDEGGYLANSNLYLITNCSQVGVTGPALISGNPIPSTSPTTSQLSQNFSFSSAYSQQIGFQYDLSEARSAGSLSITDNTIPQVGDQPLDPAIYQSTYVPQTSFATSSCLIHSGEVLPSGAPACKLYTLECKVGTSATASGAQCPVSSIPNEIFQDLFDGPTFNLSDISTPSGFFHEGLGLLMAKEAWEGGPCSFDPASGLSDVDCPQNLLASFSSGPVTATEARKLASRISSGQTDSPESETKRATEPVATHVVSSAASSSSSYTSTGRTTHPNSTFISIVGVPEPTTTANLIGAKPGYVEVLGTEQNSYWFNTDPVVSFNTQPPNLTGTSIPGAAAFVPSPILSLTYGYNNDVVPPFVSATGDPYPGDATLNDPAGCPSPLSLGTPAATPFTPATQTMKGIPEGTYFLHYFAQDCAGTEELHFLQDSGGLWSTQYYYTPFGVDRTPPTVSFSFSVGSGQYQIGDPAAISFYCSDNLSGIADCNGGGDSYTEFDPGTSTLDTSSPGTKYITLTASDVAGNKYSQTYPYYVLFPPMDGLTTLSLTTSQVTYPASTIATVKVARGPYNPSHTPQGTVQIILDGSAEVGALSLQGNGTGSGVATIYLPQLPAGKHNLTAVYLGNPSTNNFPSASSPVPFVVLPSPVSLSVSCINPSLELGVNYNCKVFTTPILAGTNTSVTWQYDSDAPVTLPLAGGTAAFSIPAPSLGRHTVTVSYAAQGNYAAAPSKTLVFTIVPK